MEHVQKVIKGKIPTEAGRDALHELQEKSRSLHVNRFVGKDGTPVVVDDVLDIAGVRDGRTVVRLKASEE